MVLIQIYLSECRIWTTPKSSIKEDVMLLLRRLYVIMDDIPCQYKTRHQSDKEASEGRKIIQRAF